MGLIGNHSILSRAVGRNYGGSSLAIAFHGETKSSNMSSAILRCRAQLQFKKAAIPSGYGPGSAIMMPRVSGELGARNISGVATVTGTALSAIIAALDSIAGTSTVTAFANAVGLIEIEAASGGVATVAGAMSAASSMTATSAGVATILANLGAIIPISATSDGVASSSVGLKGRGRLGGLITIGGTGYLSNDDVERLAAAVWESILAEYGTAGTTGKALADAGGAGNPWSADTSTNDDPGTFGERIQKLLTTTQFRSEKD